MTALAEAPSAARGASTPRAAKVRAAWPGSVLTVALTTADDEIPRPLPEELDVSGFVGPYQFPDNSRRRFPGVMYLVVGVVLVVVWLVTKGGRSPSWSTRGLRGVAAFLIVAGAVLASRPAGACTSTRRTPSWRPSSGGVPRRPRVRPAGVAGAAQPADMADPVLLGREPAPSPWVRARRRDRRPRRRNSSSKTTPRTGTTLVLSASPGSKSSPGGADGLVDLAQQAAPAARASGPQRSNRRRPTVGRMAATASAPHRRPCARRPPRSILAAPPRHDRGRQLGGQLAARRRALSMSTAAPSSGPAPRRGGARTTGTPPPGRPATRRRRRRASEPAFALSTRWEGSTS